MWVCIIVYMCPWVCVTAGSQACDKEGDNTLELKELHLLK